MADEDQATAGARRRKPAATASRQIGGGGVADRVGPAAMAPPHRIAWGKASIVRDQGGVMATLPDPKFKQVSLIFRTTNAEMQDRLEYAMKFLQMSCDATADTGF